MAYGRLDPTLYVGTGGNPEAINVATLYKPGELGSQIQVNNRAYQLVQLDSGATSSTSAGTPVCGHLAFWKNRSTHVVTNNKAQAENPGSAAGASSIAGVFCSLTSGAAGTASITAGNYGCIQQRGTHVGVLSGGNTAVAGDQLTSDVASATAQAQKFTPGSAPLSAVVGIATATTGSVTATYTPARIGGWDLVDQP